MDVWLYAYATGIERYFLNQIGVAKPGPGRWSVNGLIVGGVSPQEEGAAYIIGVLLATKEATKTIWETYTSSGIEDLPDGIEKFDEIIVYRTLTSP
jgi:hypothetical protein